MTEVPRIAAFVSHYAGHAVLRELLGMRAVLRVVLVATDDPESPCCNASARIWRYGWDDRLGQLVTRLAAEGGLEAFTGSVRREGGLLPRPVRGRAARRDHRHGVRAADPRAPARPRRAACLERASGRPGQAACRDRRPGAVRVGLSARGPLGPALRPPDDGSVRRRGRGGAVRPVPAAPGHPAGSRADARAPAPDGTRRGRAGAERLTRSVRPSAEGPTAPVGIPRRKELTMNDRTLTSIERINELWGIHVHHGRDATGDERCLAFAVGRRHLEIEDHEGLQFRVGVSFGHNPFTPEMATGFVPPPILPGRFVFGLHLIANKGHQLTIYDEWMDAREAGVCEDPEQALVLACSIVDAMPDERVLRVRPGIPRRQGAAEDFRPAPPRGFRGRARGRRSDHRVRPARMPDTPDSPRCEAPMPMYEVLSQRIYLVPPARRRRSRWRHHRPGLPVSRSRPSPAWIGRSRARPGMY